MKTFEMRRVFLWSLPVVVASILVSFFITRWFIQSVDKSNTDFLENIRILVPLELIYLWILALLNLDVWKRASSDENSQPSHAARRLAKASLILGNLSLGGVCLFVLWITLRIVGLTLTAGRVASSFGFELLAWYVLVGIAVLVFSLACSLTSRNALRKINEQDEEGDDTIKKMAKRGDLLGGLAIFLYIIAIILLSIH